MPAEQFKEFIFALIRILFELHRFYNACAAHKGKRICPEDLFHQKWNFLNFPVIYEFLLLQYCVIADRRNNEQ